MHSIKAAGVQADLSLDHKMLTSEMAKEYVDKLQSLDGDKMTMLVELNQYTKQLHPHRANNCHQLHDAGYSRFLSEQLRLYLTNRPSCPLQSRPEGDAYRVQAFEEDLCAEEQFMHANDDIGKLRATCMPGALLVLVSMLTQKEVCKKIMGEIEDLAVHLLSAIQIGSLQVKQFAAGCIWNLSSNDTVITSGSAVLDVVKNNKTLLVFRHDAIRCLQLALWNSTEKAQQVAQETADSSKKAVGQTRGALINLTGALRNLASSMEAMSFIAQKCDIITDLLELIEFNITRVQEHSIDVLFNLAVNSHNKSFLMQHDLLIERLIHIMKNGEISLSSRAIHVFASLAIDNDNKRLLMERNNFCRLLESILSQDIQSYSERMHFWNNQTPQTNFTMKRMDNLMALLVNLTTDDTNKLIFCQETDIIMNCDIIFQGNQLLLKEKLAMIYWNVCSHDGNKRIMCEKYKVVEKMRLLITQNTGIPEANALMQSACSALCNIASSTDQIVHELFSQHNVVFLLAQLFNMFVARWCIWTYYAFHHVIVECMHTIEEDILRKCQQLLAEKPEDLPSHCLISLLSRRLNKPGENYLPADMMLQLRCLFETNTTKQFRTIETDPSKQCMFFVGLCLSPAVEETERKKTITRIQNDLAAATEHQKIYSLLILRALDLNMESVNIDEKVFDDKDFFEAVLLNIKHAKDSFSAQRLVYEVCIQTNRELSLNKQINEYLRRICQLETEGVTHNQLPVYTEVNTSTFVTTPTGSTVATAGPFADSDALNIIRNEMVEMRETNQQLKLMLTAILGELSVNCFFVFFFDNWSCLFSNTNLFLAN